MGLGLLTLVNVGKENLYFSGSPEITFFKIAYKRHTNYSIEQIPQYFKTTPDFGRRCTVQLGKNADLISNIYLYVELPSIQPENISNIPKEFAWVEKIGLILINSIEIEIGGTIIDRHYSEWLNIWFELTTKYGHIKGYNTMIGNIPTLTNFSNIKYKYCLYIPLAFWFCLDIGLALPIISLKHHNIKIHVDFNDINFCYKISPMYYVEIIDRICIFEKNEIIYQNNIYAKFIYLDKLNNRMYYNPINGVFTIPISYNDPIYKIVGLKSKSHVFIKPLSLIIKNDDYFKFNKPSLVNAYLLVDYIYLDLTERKKFINNEHNYLIQTIQTVPESIAYSTNITYKLPLFNSIKLIIWRTLPVINKLYNNFFNYTLINYDNLLIKSNLLVINSINRMELNAIEYYSMLPIIQNNFTTFYKGVYMYSFAINPKELQPSGSMNFNLVNDAYLQIQLQGIVSYQNPIAIRGYAIQYNLLQVYKGISELKFS